MNKTVLDIGSKIMIKRSDGRTHLALVVFIDHECKCVKVEWREDGETRGKEIDFPAVVSLNPSFVICKPISPDVKLKVESLVNVTRRRGSSALKNTRAQSAKPRVSTNNSVKHEVCSTSDLLSIQGVNVEKLRSRVTTSESYALKNPTFKKLSKLEKNRVERRKKQAEAKAEKEELSKKCLDNPHWELTVMILEYRKKIEFRPLTVDDMIDDHLITVAVRKRPLTKADRFKKEVDIVTIPTKNQLIVHEPKYKVDLTKYLDNHVFKFDYTFDETCNNEVVYRYTAQPLIQTLFDGGFATCFAYGQTGSGKTYTMSGNCAENDAEKGIYGLAAADVFQLVNSAKYKHPGFVISCSFFEIYSKKVFDLLNNKTNLKILEDGKQQVQVVGLTEKVVSSVSEVLQLIQKGNVVRVSGQTSANANSSRSHAIFQIYLRSKHRLNSLHGKFSLIDLAGNERAADTFRSTKLTRLEGAEINQSLLALKECIRALGRKGAHLPFRACKLTQVLRDSFVGSNSKTCMIAMVSPGISSCENTLNTLRYADRVKELGGGDVNVSRSLESDENKDLETCGDKSTTSALNDLAKDVLQKQVRDCHLQFVQEMFAIAYKGEHLYDHIEEPKTYCEIWEQLVDDSLSFLVNVKDRIQEFKEKM